MISLLDAANRTGKTKPTILKAIKRGRLSALKNENGQWQIDPSELFRVYPSVNGRNAIEETVNGRAETAELEAIQRERDLLREQVEDLRRRLDDSEQERRDLSRQFTALLTDQRPREDRDREPLAEAGAGKKAKKREQRRLWQILFGLPPRKR